MKHNNIKRKGVVTCIRRDSAVAKILPNLPSECKTVVFEYKANGSQGMKSFECRRLWIQRALLLLKATGLEVWKDIEISQAKLAEWPENGNLLDIPSIRRTTASASEAGADGDEDVMEMEPAPAQNGDEEEVHVGVTSEVRETPAQAIYKVNHIVDKETNTICKPPFRLNEKVWYSCDGDKQIVRVLGIKENICRIRLFQTDGSEGSEKETTVSQLRRDLAIEQDAELMDETPQPVRVDETSATFRQDDVFELRGTIVRMENEAHAWMMAFPTLFPPRLVSSKAKGKVWATFGDFTAFPSNVFGSPLHKVRQKPWSNWMMWRSDGAPAAHSTFALVAQSVMFRNDLQAQRPSHVGQSRYPKRNDD